MRRLWRVVAGAVLVVGSACATATTHSRRPVSWTIRQIAAGYFPLPGICEAEAQHRTGVERQALLRCAIGDFDGAVYYARLALSTKDGPWIPPSNRSEPRAPR